MQWSGERDPPDDEGEAGDTCDTAPLLGDTAPLLGVTAPLLGGSAAAAAARRRRKTEEWLVYGTFLILGLGTLLPWNFFITAESYWQYKFRNVTDTPAVGEGAPPPTVDRTNLQTLYTPMQVCLSQVTNFTLLIINALFSHKIDVRLRLISSLSAVLVLFSVTTALVKVNSDDWQTAFFGVTMVLVVLINGCSAVFQGGLFGLAGLFPPRYSSAVMNGQALGGVFASFSRLVSLMVGADDITSAFIFFMIAVAVMLITMATLCYLTTTELYREYTRASASSALEGTADEREPLTAADLVAHSGRVYKEIWPYGLSVCCVFLVSLAVFPAVCVKIVSSSDNVTWANTYFQPTMTFLLFNVGDYVGRQMAGSIMWPGKGSRILYIAVGLRVVFIPLLLFCNHKGSSSAIPSLFNSDVAYFFIMALFSISNGYLGSLCMIYGPRSVRDPKDAERAGSLMAASLGLGLLVGACTSFGFGMLL